jgi:hypothetical protein
MPLMRRNLISTIALGLALAVMVLGLPQHRAEAAVPTTAFTLDSEVGDWVGQGQSLVYTPPGASVTANPYGSGVSMGATQDSRWWGARVTPPTGQTLSPGTYPTTRFSSTTTAGLDVDGDGRGCNTSTGTVTVHEVSFVDGTVERFAASYEQHCEGGTTALYGELRYNSNFEFRAASAAPSSLSFGSRAVGTTSAPQTVTVTNRGSENLTFGSGELGGAGAADFSISSDSCSGSSVTPGNSCSVQVAFSPASRGTRAALLRLPENTRRGRRDIALSGTATGITTSLSLSISRSLVSYGQSLTLSTHLDAYLDTGNRAVKFFKIPYGGSKSLVAERQLNSSGNASVSVTPTRKTTYVVEWSGDSLYEPASSPSRTVDVRAIAKFSLLGGYGTSGKYRLYHHGRLIYTRGTVVPNHAGHYLEFLAQGYVDGRWRTMSTDRFRIDSDGSVVVYYENAGIGRYRARTRFAADSDHLGDTSPWKYFRVTP